MNGGSSNMAEGNKQLSPRARMARRLISDLSIMTVIGVFLAVIGPFGSIDQPLSLRLLSWLTFAYLGYAIYSPMGLIVDRLHVALDLPVLPLWLAAALVATVPMTAAIYFVQFMPNWPPMPPLEEALTSYFYVFVIGGGVTLLFNFIGQRPALVSETRDDHDAQQDTANPQVKTDAPNIAANPLRDQLPVSLGSEIIALEMEDHYVRVHTILGSELVLMRLRDAMVHVSEIDGRQVHRSWWVARLAVEDVRREGRNVRLVLRDGLEAPVARAQVSELREAGWL